MADAIEAAALSYANVSYEDDPWAQFYAVSNDTNSESYIAWRNLVVGRENTSVIEAAPTLRPPPPPENVINLIIRGLHLFYSPIVIGIGLLGNTLTWLIFLRSRLRTLSSSHYLAAIVMVNTIYLTSLLVQWLSMYGADIYNRHCDWIS